MWVTQHYKAEKDYFKILILQETWKIQIQHQVDFCVFFEVKHLYPISWMCKKQTSVSHSSTEAELISLDAGFTHGWNTSS